MGRKVALCTGASRGIGRETAIELAKNGYDIAISARTIANGDQTANVNGKKVSLPGSLEDTMNEIEKYGVQAKTVKMDFLDENACVRALETEVLSVWETVDVFVNCAVYQGEGTLKRFMSLTSTEYQRMIQCNVLTPLALTKKLLPRLRQDGNGSIIMVSSSSVNLRPRLPVDRGGWDFGYVSTKAAISKLAGILAVEHPEFRIMNIEPGLVVTELMKHQGLDAHYTSGFGSVPPEVTAKVVAHLCTAPLNQVHHLNGRSIYAPKMCQELQLIEGYLEKKPDPKASKI